jgi:hypothetical protein
MEDSFYCICDINCIIAGARYNKNQIYRIDEFYILDRYYEINTMEGEAVGYLNAYELDCHFTTVMSVINEVDKMFNKLMDLWN